MPRNHETHPHEIHKYLITPPERKMSTTEYRFWHERGYDHSTIPQAILIATASTRKIMMMNAYLNAQFDEFGEVKQFQFPEGMSGEYQRAFTSADPLDLRNFLVDKIQNSDGSYKGLPLFIGYFQGVKVYAVSTSGETKGGQDPEEQARLKAEYLFKKKFQNLPLVIMSMDVLEEIEKGKRLGKIANEPEFPQRSHFRTKSQYKEALKDYLKVYVETIFQKAMQDGITSLTGIARLDASKEGKGAVSTRQVVSHYFPDMRRMKGILRHVLRVVDPHASGGGLLQQVINWEALVTDSQYPDAKKLEILMQIMGVQAKPTLEHAAMPRRTSTVGGSSRAAV